MKMGKTKEITEENNVIYVPKNTTIVLLRKSIQNTRHWNLHKLSMCTLALQDGPADSYFYLSNSSYCKICDRYFATAKHPASYYQQRFAGYSFVEQNKESATAVKTTAKKKWLQDVKLTKAQATRTKDRPENKKNLFKERESESVVITAKDFLVRINSFACRRNGHDCKEITACISVLKNNRQIQDIYVPAWYCNNCKCYYITERDYEDTSKIGAIIAQVYTETEWSSAKNRGSIQFNAESKLHRLGYNVGAKDDLSDLYRQSILSAAVDLGIMSKREIIDFLTLMINMRRNDPRMQNAVYRWNKDLKFINNYKLNTKKYTRVKSINLRRMI